MLEVRDLRIDIASRSGTARAVDGASLTVASGEALGVVGESGSGKTLTLRAILGLLPRGARVTGGDIRYDGSSLTSASPAELRAVRGRRIAMVFQEPMTALNPVMRAGDQIAEAIQVGLGRGSQRAHAEAVDLMRDVGIPDPVRRARGYPHEFSGGMRQRVMIAMAVACRPALLLCDEPTTALDVTTQDQILQLLTRLCNERGMGLVYVTHDLSVVSEVCQRLAVMYAGQVVETGPVGEILREPRHPYTLGLLRAVPDVDRPAQQLDPIEGQPPDPTQRPAGCPFHPRCEFAVPECRSGDFPLRDVGGGRSTACIRSDELSGVGTEARDA